MPTPPKTPEKQTTEPTKPQRVREVNCLSLFSGGVMPKLPSRSFFKLMVLGFHAGHAQATGTNFRRNTYAKFVQWMQLDQSAFERTQYVDATRYGQGELEELHKYITERDNCFRLYAISNFEYDLENVMKEQPDLARFLKPTNQALLIDAGCYMVLGIMHVIKWTFVGYYHGTLQEQKFRSIEPIITDFERWIRLPQLIKIKLTPADYQSYLNELNILQRFSNAAEMLGR